MARPAQTSATAPPAAIGTGELWPLARLQRHPSVGVLPEPDRKAYQAFVADVDLRGIQVPLDVTAAGMVLDGHLRLRAAVTLNHSQVPVRVVAPGDEFEYMVLAAIQRRQLNAGQCAALALELQVYRDARDQAEARRLANLKGQRADVAKLPPQGRTRDLVARDAGVSARTVQDAITVYQGDPELFRAVKEGRLAVAAAAERVRRRERDIGIGAPPPLPAGLFDLIYGDPPWSLGATNSERGPNRHYPTMTVDEIAALQIPAAKDALLFLWAVDGHLPDALQVMQAWGFRYVNSVIWVKDRIGLGTWVRNQHEQLLIGVRGKVSPPPPELRVPSVVHARA